MSCPTRGRICSVAFHSGHGCIYPSAWRSTVRSCIPRHCGQVWTPFCRRRSFPSHHEQRGSRKQGAQQGGCHRWERYGADTHPPNSLTEPSGWSTDDPPARPREQLGVWGPNQSIRSTANNTKSPQDTPPEEDILIYCFFKTRLWSKS